MSERRMLEGIKVLDLTNVLAGPFATLHLALLGAEVIKVENPKDGDLARKLGIVPDYNRQLMGTSFLAQNCNKKSITLNTKAPEGKAIFLRLAAQADVLVENFRPGVMDRLGLGYAELAKVNPRLIYCAISGFGQTGPDALKPAYDQIIQGLSGEMAVNGDERLNPLRTGFPVCDTVGGMNAAFAIMTALYDRERTGEGQCIDVALLDSIMPLMGWVAANLLIGGQEPVLMGNDNFTAAPSGTFRTRDGFINIAANKQEQWESVCDVLGVPELKTDPRFQERDTRKRNRKELTPLLEARLAAMPTDHWVEALNASDVPSGAILGLAEALRQPQAQHRKVLQKTRAEVVGEIEVFGLTAKFSKGSGDVAAPPPTLGQHNAEIFGRLGLTGAELEALAAGGVIGFTRQPEIPQEPVQDQPGRSGARRRGKRRPDGEPGRFLRGSGAEQPPLPRDF
jgi:CoA:oxalate CoA-transferase